MTTTEQPTVVGIFEDQAKAEQAIHELQQAGFHNDQISYSGHEASSSDIHASLRRFFVSQETMSDNVPDNHLVKMGMPEADARYYQQEYKAGRSMVAVTDGKSLPEAMTILTRNRAYGAKMPSSYGSTTRTGGRETATNAEEESSLHLYEEQLQVYKRSVQTGEVRLGKEVVTEQKTINVPVTHEEIYIEHRPPSGQVTETSIGEGKTIEVPVYEEQVNATKQTVEAGEVALGKRQVQETQQVSDAVRREEARFEVEGKVDIQESDQNESTQQSEHEKKQS